MLNVFTCTNIFAFIIRGLELSNYPGGHVNSIVMKNPRNIYVIYIFLPNILFVHCMYTLFLFRFFKSLYAQAECCQIPRREVKPDADAVVVIKHLS